MIENKHIYILAVTAVLAGLLSSCSKYGSGTIDPKSEGIVRFSPALEQAVVSTRGELINPGESKQDFPTDRVFFASAWTGTTKDFGYDKVAYKTTASGGYWITVFGSGGYEGKDKEYLWKKGSEKTFYAYSNLPAAAGAASVESATSAGQTLKYDLSKCSDAADQKDILLGFYKGNGNNRGLASITFKHPLTAVGFVIDDLDGETVKTISLSGVYKSGTATMDGTGSISWSSQVAGGTTSQSKEGGLGIASSDPKIVGSWFLLIPQTITGTAKVTISLEFVSGKTATAELSEGSWIAGQPNLYKLKYVGVSPMDAVLTVTLADWQTLKNKDGGDVFDVTFGTKPTE